MNPEKICLYCNKPIEGRSDKKFCDTYCKSAYHYRVSQEKPINFFNRVDKQLKLNRQILKGFNKAGLSIVQDDVLLEKGFNPKFFTHYWKNKKGEVYLFVYEFGFLKKVERGKVKYILVHWQKYMNRG